MFWDNTEAKAKQETHNLLERANALVNKQHDDSRFRDAVKETIFKREIDGEELQLPQNYRDEWAQYAYSMYLAPTQPPPDTLETYDSPEGRLYRVKLREWIEERTGSVTHNDATDEIALAFAAFADALPDIMWKPTHDPFISYYADLLDFIEDPHTLVDEIVSAILRADGTYERHALYKNIRQVSGIEENNKRPVVMPKDYIYMDVSEVYLKDTCFYDMFQTKCPIGIPHTLRTSHHWILGGSGHGKTQTLQSLIIKDIEHVPDVSVIVMDSQGDMIKKLSKTQAVRNKVAIIDPEDVEFPIQLNLFDIQLERIKELPPVDREKAINGALEMLSYIINSLVGAQLTSKQDTLFRYVIRLLISIPGAHIGQFMELMEDPTPFIPHIKKLPDMQRKFFEREVLDPKNREFQQTKQQVLRRLWALMENDTFAKMFTNPTSKVDMGRFMNEGKVVLINTSKDLLKDSYETFGRFFIALVTQAALSRASIPESQRKPVYFYIDECHDYIDDNVITILEQARKYNVGVILAHQGLYQLTPPVQAALMANTAIKMAGGTSDQDARKLAQDMRCDPSLIMNQTPTKKETSFAVYARGGTAASVSFPFGQLEQQPVQSEADIQAQLTVNRDLFSRQPEEYEEPVFRDILEAPAPQEIDPDSDSATGY